MCKLFIKRFNMLLKGKWRFINYRKEFNGQFPIYRWMPTLNKFWMGNIWQILWRGYAISIDMRDNWIADMVDPHRKDK